MRPGRPGPPIRPLSCPRRRAGGDGLRWGVVPVLRAPPRCPPCQGERVPLLRPGSACPWGPRFPAACWSSGTLQPCGFTAAIVIVSQGPVGRELGQGLVGWALALCGVCRATMSVASSLSRVALRGWTGSEPWRRGGPTRTCVLRASVPALGWGVHYLLRLPRHLKTWWPRT